MQEVNKETGMTYAEIKQISENNIDETPIRVINAPAQVAMLQDVLSMALNKIEILEAEVQALKNNK